MTYRFQLPAEPLVERNPFRQGERRSSLTNFADVRSCLPVPVFPQQPGW